MKVSYGYLDRQFASNTDQLWYRVRSTIVRGDFTLGEEVREFERNFAARMGAKHCLGVANGTDALELAIWAQSFPPGSEIIVPVNTFVASAAAIVTAGMQPVFADTNDKFVIDPDTIEGLVTEKTVAILPVHFGGQPADMQAICAIAQRRTLAVIEDAAQAADATSNAGPCGSVGDAAGVSFHPQKNLNCWGDGGAILTSDTETYQKLALYRNHGMIDRDTYAFASRNSRLDSVNAAVLNHFLPDLHEDNNKRIAVATAYSAAFERLGIEVPRPAHNERHTYHLYMIRVPAFLRDDLLKHLNYFGVEARIHYPKPLHLQPAFAPYTSARRNFPFAMEHAATMLSLPIHQYLRQDEVEYVIDVVRRFYE